MRKKLTIIGAGNAALMTAMHFSTHTDYEIEIMHNPEKQPLDVGMGMTISPARAIEDHYNYLELKEKFNATLKKGILYKDWSQKIPNLWHEFFLSTSTYHLDVNKLRQDYFSNNHKIIEKDFSGNYSEIDSDFIIDCTGYSPETNYIQLKNPINKCGLFTEDKMDIDYTLTIAKKYGWIFKIPLTDKTACGYLYNDEFEDKLDYKFDKVIPIRSYVAPNVFVDDRVAINGNKYFFLEPMEASALGVYNYIARCIYDVFVLGGEKTFINDCLFKYIKDIESFIGYHYYTQDMMDSPFWEMAYNETKDLDYTKINNLQDIGQWPKKSIEVWNEGFDLNKESIYARNNTSPNSIITNKSTIRSICSYLFNKAKKQVKKG